MIGDAMNLSMKQIRERVQAFSQIKIGETVEPSGLVVARFPPLSEVHKYKRSLIRDNLTYLVESDLIGV